MEQRRDLLGSITSFWAKFETDRDGHLGSWHPLVDHCADVAACVAALLNQPVVRTRIARLSGQEDLESTACQRLSVLAALHDFGKFNHGFQNKAFPERTPTAGHLREALALLFSNLKVQGRLSDALDLQTLSSWAVDPDIPIRLLVAAISHHGRPVDPRALEPDGALWQPHAGRDPIAGVADLTARARTWFPEAFLGGSAPLPEAPAFQHAFAGLVMLADWLGSDVSFFPFTTEAGGDRWPFATEHARQAVASVGLDVRAVREVLGTAPPAFDQVFGGRSPRPAQREIQGLPVSHEGTVTVLEAETGSGKTEAALVQYLKLFQSGHVDGLYFALPTRTAATQIYHRVVAAVAAAFRSSENAPPVVLAVPGYLSVDGVEGQRLPGFEVLWNDDQFERFRFRGWAAEHPKRYLAAPVAVGTIDQVLLSTLAVSHAHLRASSLLRHLLVVDEVHCSDAYMNRLLREVLKRHVAAGGHALLMSATLGSEARELLLRPETPLRALRLPTYQEACVFPYPCLTHRDFGGDPRLCEVPASGYEKTVTAQLKTLASDSGAIAELAVSAALQGAVVLVLRNTVRDCIATQRALEQLAKTRGALQLLLACEGTPAPHHARFAREDRNQLDQALEAALGQQRELGGRIAVTTQTAQQSLDLDADLLITDLCPMDVLLQRIGRLHRHPRPRPAAFQEARAIVLTPGNRDLGTLISADGRARGPYGIGTVYSDLRILEATLQVLEQSATVLIPQMNRWLVETTTHPERLAAVVSSLGGRWPAHEAQVRGILAGDRRLAQLNLMSWESPFCGRDEHDHDWLFPPQELSGLIKTRLGEGDRLAEFREPFESPFGQQVRHLTIPAYWAKDAAPDEAPRLLKVEDGRTHFQFGTRVFVYDRLGLRPEASSVEDDSADA